MVFLDPIANASSEVVAGLLIYVILFGTAITLIFSILFIVHKIKRNIVSISAFVITSINTVIIALVLVFGSLLTWADDVFEKSAFLQITNTKGRDFYLASNYMGYYHAVSGGWSYNFLYEKKWAIVLVAICRNANQSYFGIVFSNLCEYYYRPNTFRCGDSYDGIKYVTLSTKQHLNWFPLL